MQNRFSILLLVFFLFSINSFCQNTNETPNLTPDTNNTINNALPPPSGGGVAAPSPTTSPEKSMELEIKEEAPAEMEESPARSEPVPGAEILIEQEQNDIRNQPPQPAEENKGKKKNKEKPNK